MHHFCLYRLCHSSYRRGAWGSKVLGAYFPPIYSSQLLNAIPVRSRAEDTHGFSTPSISGSGVTILTLRTFGPFLQFLPCSFLPSSPKSRRAPPSHLFRNNLVRFGDRRCEPACCH